MFTKYDRGIALAVVIVLLLTLVDGHSSRRRSASYEDGYQSGYTNGYDEGQASGYSAGEEDGYYEGATYTCLFYGDVDRAFQSAKNGCAWRTFVSAYDQYVSDICTTEEEESSLSWALLSITSPDGATPQEAALLAKTFGRELFTKNGVSIP